jgi:hypothetical protein
MSIATLHFLASVVTPVPGHSGSPPGPGAQVALGAGGRQFDSGVQVLQVTEGASVEEAAPQVGYGPFHPAFGLGPIGVPGNGFEAAVIGEPEVVEHNIRSILDVATRVYVLDKGKIAHDGTPSTVEESEILTKVFLGAAE